LFVCLFCIYFIFNYVCLLKRRFVCSLKIVVGRIEKLFSAPSAKEDDVAWSFRLCVCILVVGENCAKRLNRSRCRLGCGLGCGNGTMFQEWARIRPGKGIFIYLFNYQDDVWWGAGMVICLERVADLHMSQLMPLPLTVSCFGKMQIGFAFLVPTYPGSPGIRAVKWVCVCVCVCVGCVWCSSVLFICLFCIYFI